MVARVCPRGCGIRLHTTWPGEPALCRACGFEDYANYRSPEPSGGVTTDFIRRVGAATPGTATNTRMLSYRRRRTAECLDWLEANAPDIPLTRVHTGGRPRLADPVGRAFKTLVEVHGISHAAVAEHYGLHHSTVRREIRRVG